MTEQEAREMRLDRMQFKSLEDAIAFGENNKLQTRGIYKYPDGYFKICKYTKSKTELYGRFIGGKFIEGSGVMVSNKKYGPNRKDIDGKKLESFLILNGINKTDLCSAIHRSKAFINDIIRRNNVDSLAWEKLCEVLGVPLDFFDIKKPEPEVEEQTGVILDETDHDILVSLLLSQKKIEALLMEIVSLLK